MDKEDFLLLQVPMHRNLGSGQERLGADGDGAAGVLGIDLDGDLSGTRRPQFQRFAFTRLQNRLHGVDRSDQLSAISRQLKADC